MGPMCIPTANDAVATGVMGFAPAIPKGSRFPSRPSCRIMRAGRATALSQLFDSQRSEASRP